MSQVRRLDQIPDAVDFDGSDSIAIWQNGRTRRTTVADLALRFLDLSALADLSIPTQGTFQSLAASRLPAPVQVVRLSGYYSPGDGGGATWVRLPSAPVSPRPWHVQSANGVWWGLSGDDIDPRALGAIGGAKDATVSTLPNDYAALQAALDYLGQTGGTLRLPGHLQFRTDTGLFARVTRQLPVAAAGVGIHFAPNLSFEITSAGKGVIVAGATMVSVLTLQFNSSLTNIGPFKSIVSSLDIRGNGLAQFGVTSDFCLHTTVERCGIDGVVSACLNWSGYGVARINSNVMRGPTCVRFQGGGGDSILFANDYFPGANGKCVYVGKLGGNTLVLGGTMNGEGNVGCIGVDVSVDGGGSDEVRHVKVDGIEFSGMLYGVRGLSAAGVRNVYGVDVRNCHTTPSAGGAVNSGVIAHMTRVDKFTASSNRGNGVPGSLCTDSAFLLFDCDDWQIEGNKIRDYSGPGGYFSACTNGRFCNNEMRDTARASPTTPILDLDGGTNSSQFNDNTIIQTSASFGQLGLFERAGATANEGLRNKWQLVATPGTIASGSSSVFRQFTGPFAEGSASQNGTTASVSGARNMSVTRVSLGRCRVNFGTPHPDTNYTPKVVGVGCKVEVESKLAASFVVLMLDLSDSPVDAQFEVEVTSRAP